MPTLEEVLATLGTPAGMIGTLIVGVAINIVTKCLGLIFGRSRNAIFTFTKKRSGQQIAARQQRVKLMRREEKWLHAYLSSVNTTFLMAVVFLVMSVLAFVVAFSGVGYVSLFVLVAGVLCSMVSLYFISEGIAIQRDIAEALPDILNDDDEAPL